MCQSNLFRDVLFWQALRVPHQRMELFVFVAGSQCNIANHVRSTQFVALIVLCC